MKAVPQDRYLAIDVLRGMTVALMIIVNMSIGHAQSFAQLLHAHWDGFTLTDLVYPTFLFVVGASLGFTAERYAREGAGPYFRRVLERSVRIFICGFIVSNFPFFTLTDGHFVWASPENWRIMGVLQRIALCYLLAATVLYRSGVRGAILFSIVALIGTEIAMQLGGDRSLTGNLQVMIDRMFLGERHLYQLEGAPFDPEGLFGTIPATVNVLAGYVAVRFLRARAAVGIGGRDLVAMAGVGLLLVAAGLGLSHWIPVNKKLWSTSYVLLTIGLDMMLLALMVQIVDRSGLRSFAAPFEAFGKNALAVYMAAELVMGLGWAISFNGTPLFLLVYERLFAPIGGKWGSLVYALLFAACCWAFARMLDRRRIYIRL